MLFLNNATVVTGDGTTIIDGGAVVVENGRILEVRRRPATGGKDDEALDLGGRLLMPGAVNPHTHGVTIGPLLPGAAASLSREQVLANRDRHLCQGHTTILSGDGFALPEEFDVLKGQHPANIVPASTHWPTAIQAARQADGSGLTPAHEAMTAAKMVEWGVAVLGEAGGGETLAGGPTDRRDIPAAVARETGRTIDAGQAKELKLAVLGLRVKKEAYDREKVASVLRQIGLDGVITPEKVRDMIVETVVPGFQVSLESLVDAGRHAAKLGVPALLHNSPQSEEAVLAAAEIAGEGMLIAGHTNVPLFKPEESIAWAKRLKARGAWIEVCTMDSFGARQAAPGGDQNMYAMLREGVVDFFATDFANGKWDGIYLAAGRALKADAIELAPVVAMVSRNALRAIPRLAPDRGGIEPGKVADLVVSAANDPGAIERVYASGKLVVQNGVRV